MPRPEGAGAENAPGQQKQHEIVNTETGETRLVTQAEWRESGKALRAEGFERTEDDGDDAEPMPAPVE